MKLNSSGARRIINENLVSLTDVWSAVVFSPMVLSSKAKRVCDDDEIVSILNVGTENISYVSSSGSDHEMFDTGTNKRE
jgi:hypothetical protein